LNAELDDQHMTECQTNSSAFCDLCQTREVERNTVRENVLTSQQSIEIERLKFFQILDHLTDVCTFCFVLSLDSETFNDHTLKDCSKHQLKVSFYFSTLNKL